MIAPARNATRSAHTVRNTVQRSLASCFAARRNSLISGCDWGGCGVRFTSHGRMSARLRGGITIALCPFQMMIALPIRVGLCAAWLVAVVAGLGVLISYQNAAGVAGETPRQWPATAQLSPDPSRPTLLMFVHPQCPCSRASMEELNRLLAQNGGRVKTHVLFLRPSGLAANWTHTGLRQTAAAIPGVTVHDDVDGVQAKNFGAETSGQVLLYDARGNLLFTGGITEGRGHAGDNAGVTTIVSLLQGQNVSSSQTPVYGCALQDTCEMTSQRRLAWKQ